MATVDGITVAAADEIDKKHIAAMSVVGGDLVLTRENLATISTALPTGGGGGGPIGQSEMWASTTAKRSSGEGGLIETSYAWSAESNPDGGDLAGITIGTGGDAGKLLLPDAGWYSVFVYLEIAFDDASPVTYTRMAINCGNSLAGNQEAWYTPSPIIGGSTKWIKAWECIGPIYSDGTAYLRPEVRWDSGHYGAGDHGDSIGVNIVRLS